jgi:hypothetical protein
MRIFPPEPTETWKDTRFLLFFAIEDFYRAKKTGNAIAPNNFAVYPEIK